MFEDFVLRAWLAGSMVAFTAGILGCFVVWRKMAYFGDALSHSALLGIALGFISGIGSGAGTIIICTAFAMLLVWLGQQKMLARDTLLGIIAHAGLSAGIVMLGLLRQPVDLHGYLFGDLLTITPRLLIWIAVGCACILAALFWNWRALILLSIHEDLARAEQVRTLAMQMLLVLLLALIVAVSIRIVGVLLITALLIIPAATARLWARSPESMAALSALFGIGAVFGGLNIAVGFDIPAGPSIVALASLVCLCTFGGAAILHYRSLRRKLRQ
ncbi:MAG: metal ABC transporter permease [Pseudomonadota bacterium]